MAFDILKKFENYLPIDAESGSKLTSEQKHQARTNIGAGTSDFSGSYTSLKDQPHAVLYDEQELQLTQQAQVRTNSEIQKDLGLSIVDGQICQTFEVES